jgi:hypothetical protein
MASVPARRDWGISLTGISFIGVALAFAAGAFVPSPDIGQPAAALAAVAAATERFLFGALMDLAYGILLVPALLGVARLPRGRGAQLTAIGAGMALFGNLGHFSIVSLELILRDMVGPGADRAQMLALLDRINNDTAILFILPMMLAYVVGAALMVVGLWRRQVISIWPLLFSLTAIGIELLPLPFDTFQLKVVVGSIGFALIGLDVIRYARSRDATG